MAKENRKLYQAKFEMGLSGEAFQHPEAILDKASSNGTVAGFVDFMTGFPMAVIELQAIVGEISSRPDLKDQLVESVQDSEMASPAFPQTLFGGYLDEKILMNLMYIENDYSDFMAKDLDDEDPLKGLHWWLRTNLMSDIGGDPRKWPYPTEFLGLAVRLFPSRFSDSQESNPFIYSGCFLDTVYFTAGFIKEIVDPTDEKPWPSYKVTWRKDPDNPDSTGEYLLFPTDWTEYKVGDRVLIIKDVTTGKKSHLWKDDDMKTMGGEKTDPKTPVKTCALAPLYFFKINPDKEG